MTFAWADYLDLAQAMVDSHGDEAAQRTAISRACYVAYHRASQFVRARSLVAESEALRHDLVWRLLLRQPEAVVQLAAAGEFELKRRRLHADYRLRFPGNIDDVAVKSLRQAEEVIQLLGAV